MHELRETCVRWITVRPSLLYMVKHSHTGLEQVPFSFSSLAVMFSEQLIWRDYLSEEGSFTQRDVEIMILHVREWVE